jgi:hypothetical protein
MSKWADYLITAVRYNAAGLHIERVRVSEDKGDTLGEPQEMSRAEVVKLLAVGKTFVTAPKSVNEPGKLSKGASVNIFPVQTRFIKTKADNRESDNLENLPTF